MSDYILSCCSTADLSAELMEARDIHYICFHYEVDGTNIIYVSIMKLTVQRIRMISDSLSRFQGFIR